jgi:hypothetical protein
MLQVEGKAHGEAVPVSVISWVTGAATDYNKATQGRKNEKKVTLSLPVDVVIAF